MSKKLDFKKYLLLIPVLSGILYCGNLQAAGLKDGFSNSGSDLDNFAKSAAYQSPQDPTYYLGLILTALFSTLGIVAIALTLYSGFVWMTAQGNEAKVTRAKETITESIIGLLFIIGSYALATFLLKIFT